MMAEHLIPLAFERDVVQAGTLEVVRALAQPARYPHLDNFDRMRQRVADNMVSLAFRRYLDAEKIPYENAESVNFTQMDWFDITFGGRRCVPFAQMVCNRKLIQQVHDTPEVLLDGNVYLPEGAAMGGYRDVDIYLFIHLTGLVTRSRDDVEKAIVAGQPIYMVYQMPDVWSIPQRWERFDPLVLKTDVSETLKLELFGQDGRRGVQMVDVTLPGRQRVAVSPGLFTVGAMRANTLPSGPMGLHSQKLGDTLLVSPFQWGNIWVYALRMVLTGYITQADFFRQASRVKGQAAGQQNPCVRGENLFSLPAAALKPPQDLFVRAANWAQMKKR